MLKKQFAKIQSLCQIAAFAHRIVPFYNKNYCSVFFNAVRLCRRERFLPYEAFKFGLFRLDFPQNRMCEYISRKSLTKIQESVNPVSWQPLLKDKGIFYRYCMALGVPVPKLYAIFFKKTAGWSNSGLLLINRDDWKKFFDTELACEFVIKPAGGAFGKKVNIFRKTENGFADVSGKTYDSGQLFDVLASDTEFDSFLIQQRIINHPELSRLSGTDYLQTVRFITFVDGSGNCNFLITYLKIITSGNFIDNRGGGLTGNWEVLICPHTGVLDYAKKLNLDGSGLADVSVHPKTGIAFKGFRLPMWEQTCNLVKQTALKFLPIRTVGWDVAITPDGPVISEGNICPNPPNGFADYRLFFRPFIEFTEKPLLPLRFSS